MRTKQVALLYCLYIIIAILSLMASAGGLFLKGLYWDSDFTKKVWYGNDLVTLTVAIPILMIAILLSKRGSERAQLVWLGLLSSQINYTCTYLADYLADLTHDNVQYFLKTSRFSPRQIWQSLKGVIQLSPRGYLIFDDRVLNKEYSYRIELVRRQYSGNVHGIIKGIGVVNVFISTYSSPTSGRCSTKLTHG